jgi:tellurite resistance protein TerC
MSAPVPITFWHWAGFVTVVLALLALDLGVFHRASRIIRPKEALLWTAFWLLLSLLFAGALRKWRGPEESLEFITGYFVEFSLSLDNVVAIAVIFTSFGIAAQYQHRVLFWGILGALVMRGGMIAAGASLIHAFHWVLWLMGLFLIFTGVQWAFSRQIAFAPEKNPALRCLRKLLPVSDHCDGPKFLTFANGRRVLTPLALVLLMVEVTDLIFAFDSVPAVFAVTRNTFIVFTSNICAILGLRSLYCAAAGIIRYSHCLKAGLAAVLIFVGAKMLASAWWTASTGLSLAVVAAIMAVSTGFSIRSVRKGGRP